jgi:hypothetical protein
MSQQSAMASGASMATIYENTYELQKKAAGVNIGMGAAQVMMGVLINNQAGQHKKLGKDFNSLNFKSASDGTNAAGAKMDTITGSGNTDMTTAGVGSQSVAAKVFDKSTDGINATMGAGNTAIVADKDEAGAVKSAKSYSSAITAEQNAANKDGSASGVMNMAQGGAAVVSGAFQYMTANAMEKLVKQMAGLATAQAPGSDPFAPATATTAGASTITGDGTSGTSAATAATSPAATSSGGPLGAPLGGPPLGGVLGIGPSPGVPGPSTADGGGSGSGGGIGAVGTSAAPSTPDDPQAKYADNGRGAVVPYEQVGGYSAGGGGGGKGNSNDPSINPKDLMAAMLDQMGMAKKDDPQGRDIMSYRSLASDAPFAPLPKDEEVFGYIHNAYQALQRNRRVGLN